MYYYITIECDIIFTINNGKGSDAPVTEEAGYKLILIKSEAKDSKIVI